MDGIELLKEIKSNQEKYLPIPSLVNRIVPRQGEEYEGEPGDINMGWNITLIDDKRPLYLECWANYHATFLTMYTSTLGMENMNVEEFDELMEKTGIYHKISEEFYPSLHIFFDANKNEFYTYTIVVGDDYNLFITDGIPTRTFRILNEYNEKEKAAASEIKKRKKQIRKGVKI